MNNTSSTSQATATTPKKLIKSNLNGDNWQLNACVGRNTGSHDNSIGYSGGFQAAAEVMLKLVGVARPTHTDESWGRHPLIDMLVYPICYCARHHVELVIKRALPRTWNIFKMRSPYDSQGLSEPQQTELTHSVFSVWSSLDEICHKADQRLSALMCELKPYIIEIDAIDRSGQTFRYALNADDSKPHLSDLSHINLQYFAEGYAELCRILEELEFSIEAIELEYATGTYTSKLNRNQLIEIAKILPPHDQWATTSFTEAKLRITTDYQLSSNDFQRACDIIQRTRALAFHIGVSIPIKDLDSNTFVRLRNVSKGDRAAMASLNIAERSAVFALLQIGSPDMYPEQFESFLGPRPVDEDSACQFEVERAADYLARRASSRPDLLVHALMGLGQSKLLSDFRDIFKEELEYLAADRELDLDTDFAKLFRSRVPKTP